MNNAERDHYLDLLGITQWQRRDDARFAQDAHQPLASAASLTEAADHSDTENHSPSPAVFINRDATAAVDHVKPTLTSKKQTPETPVNHAPVERGPADAVTTQPSALNVVVDEGFALQGEGNPHANCLVLGEIAVSDATDDAFAAQEKVLLKNMLHAIGLSLDAVFTVKPLECLASALRDPQETELQTCYQYLEKHIRLIQPQVILVMHQLTAQVLLQSENTLTQLRDQSHAFAQSKIIVTFPPTHLLKRPGDKAKAWQDLKQLKSLLDLC